MSNKPNSLRNSVIDNLKALGIFLVVLGHAPGIPLWLINLIYSFHMPFFFFISGYLLSRDRLLQESWRSWIWYSVHKLLLPWLLFYLISWGYQVLASVTRGDSLAGLLGTTPVLDFLTGTSASMSVNLVLWFFPALFVTSAVFRGLYRQLPETNIWVVATFLALIWLYVSSMLEARWLWSADTVPVALFFYTLGYAMVIKGKKVERHLLLYKHPLWGGAWLCGLVLLVALNGRVDLNGLSWGKWPLLYMPTACWGIAGLWWCAAHMPASRLATWFAQNSLIIFPLHPLFFGVITGVCILILRFPEGFQYSTPVAGLVYIVLALLLSYPAAWILRRLLPR
jgi:acyltransferase